MDGTDDVDRRLEELRRHPELLSRWDLNRDGQLDDREWALVRRMVEHEVESARRRGRELPTDFEPEVLRDRYEIVGLLGRGGQAETFLAIDRDDDDRHVVAKILEIEVAEDWKSIELFEREAEVLERLNHPRIPAYVDHFHDHIGDRVRFVVMQQFIDGTDLGARVERGQTWTPDEARRNLRKIAEVLRYLHALSPPVVHRDIKPSNLIRGEDGELYLVDFGAAQNIVPTTAGGSTIIGTSGYVPMEQYMGRACAASDVYALGATALHMLSGVHPADHQFERGRLVTTRHVADAAVRELLDAMLEPHLEDRIADADELLRRLDRESTTTHLQTTAVQTTAVQTTSAPTTALAEHDPTALAKALEVRAGLHTFVYSDQARPWLGITCTNDGDRTNRYVYRRSSSLNATITLIAEGNDLQVRADGLGESRAANSLALVLGALVFAFAVGPLVFAALVLLPVILLYRNKTGHLDSSGWNCSTLLDIDDIQRFDVTATQIEVYDQEGRLRDALPFAPISDEARQYVGVVLNTHLDDLQSRRRPRTNERW